MLVGCMNFSPVSFLSSSPVSSVAVPIRAKCPMISIVPIASVSTRGIPIPVVPMECDTAKYGFSDSDLNNPDKALVRFNIKNFFGFVKANGNFILVI